MIQKKLGTLQKVNLRDVWETEAKDFTPWLAKEENIKILGTTIAVDLEVEAQEKNVGPFRADILCKDIDNDNWVLIENQLEKTDHGHFGQILTYAAGLHAVTVVWVAATFTEEHRATLDWMNEITDNRFRFFGLEIELWRIDESPAAPKFNIVSKPNDWSRSITESAKKMARSQQDELRLRYWTEFKTAVDEKESDINFPRPQPRQWMGLGIGRSGFQIMATINLRDRRLGVELYISGDSAKPHYHLLHREMEEVEASLGESLEWMELPEKQASRIVLFNVKCDPTDESDWSNQHKWFIETIKKFDKTFRKRVKDLNAEDWEFEDETIN